LSESSVKFVCVYRHKTYLRYPRPIFDPQQTVMFGVLIICFCLTIVVCVFFLL